MVAPARISLREAAERLGVHYMTAYRYVRTGRLPAEREGAQWSVALADVQRFMTGGPSRGRHLAKSERPTRLSERLLAGDEAGSWAVVEGALASGAQPADVYLDVLAPALRSIGDSWELGAISVADEHRASAVAQRIVGRLGPRFARRGRSRGAVVLGSPSGELHAIPTAMVADLLRLAGFEAIDLGPNTPPESFVAAAAGADRLVAVLVGVTTPGQDATVRKVLRSLRQADLDVPLLAGGNAIVSEDHARRLGADGWSGHDGHSAVRAVEDSVTRSAPRASGARTAE